MPRTVVPLSEANFKRAQRLAKTEAQAAKFMGMLRSQGLPLPHRECQFHPVRKWRVDFGWPHARIGLEVEGGVFAKGKSRHTTGAGFRADIEKYNTATVLGWRIVRVLPEQLCTEATVQMISDLLEPSR